MSIKLNKNNTLSTQTFNFINLHPDAYPPIDSQNLTLPDQTIYFDILDERTDEKQGFVMLQKILKDEETFQNEYELLMGCFDTNHHIASTVICALLETAEVRALTNPSISVVIADTNEKLRKYMFPVLKSLDFEQQGDFMMTKFIRK